MDTEKKGGWAHGRLSQCTLVSEGTDGAGPGRRPWGRRTTAAAAAARHDPRLRPRTFPSGLPVMAAANARRARKTPRLMEAGMGALLVPAELPVQRRRTSPSGGGGGARGLFRPRFRRGGFH